MKKLDSLSIFFPFFNDEGTVETAIDQAYEVGKHVSNDLEVIAIHGGNSKDKTWQKIEAAKRKHPKLKIIDRHQNTIGYAVITFGLHAASKEWVFYTDGDLQYDLKELPLLITEAQRKHVDIVNGYKVNRQDSFARIFLGKIYQNISKQLFSLPIRDVDCDFRLMKKSYLDQIKLVSTHAAILPELIYKLKNAGATFSEIPVSHFARRYGKSNYSWWQLSWEKIKGDSQLYFELKKLKQNQGRSRS